MGKTIVSVTVMAATMGLFQIGLGAGQQQNTATAAPKTLTAEELPHLDKFDGQLIQLTVTARHLGSERVFAIGEEQRREVRVLIPNPAVDTAAVGDVVTIIGTVRRFNSKAFAQQYMWFKEADYRPIATGDLVIVASSVRSPAGGELVPGDPATKKAPPATP
jgi:hypothetical protein